MGSKAESHEEPRLLLTIQNLIGICSPYGIEGYGFSPSTGGLATLHTTKHDRWMGICESINGRTHTSKVWAILRSLLGQRKTYNGAARVALWEGISAQEFAEQAAQVFFPQTSHPTHTTYQKDASSEDNEPLNSPFTLLDLEHGLQNAHDVVLQEPMWCALLIYAIYPLSTKTLF
ncbi:hypothetical protein HPB50_006575 [Hyalomma asiaticum]|uniref:Uncharacterized protein n=1 Tax=Hyalomma asiaticum TaxID=266040 RepID=A0ACB7SS53_HYAAI|nr:hypothetical protein HPB50_006575 [Hyalomma asiaticum]